LLHRDTGKTQKTQQPFLHRNTGKTTLTQTSQMKGDNLPEKNQVRYTFVSKRLGIRQGAKVASTPKSYVFAVAHQ